MSDKKFILLVITLILVYILSQYTLSFLRKQESIKSLSILSSFRAKSRNLTPQTLSTLTPSSTFSPQTNSEGEVDIKVTPVTLIPNQKPSFKISFDTHSVELDFDITQISTLTDDENNSFSNPSWGGSPPGGHHRSGTLTFNEPLKKTESISLVLKDISNIPERKFTWNLIN